MIVDNVSNKVVEIFVVDVIFRENNNFQLTQHVGTITFMSPEILTTDSPGGYGNKVNLCATINLYTKLNNKITVLRAEYWQ